MAGHRDEQKRQLLAEASRRWNLAAESERRRIERDLHDGAQQHLVTLALYARAAEASAPAELAELKHQMSRIASGLAEVSMELQEISRGIRPAILAKGGLPTAIKELARRSPVPVRLDVALTDRLPEPIQTATYYLVAEALTNTAKHAHACTVHVQVDTDHTDAADPVLRISVRDDGRGGADPHGGSGLVGLTDRVDALGGRLWLHSPPGAGTTLRAEVPLRQAPPRLSLVDALLDGRAFDEWSLRDLAGHLRLPINGPFVVIAAHIPSAGDEPLPEIESKLRSLDTFSAWRRLPDMQVGITHVESDHKLDRVVALMSRMTTARVGVSAPFEDLRDTPRALHVARVMLRGPTDSTSSVAVFDGSILATAAAARRRR